MGFIDEFWKAAAELDPEAAALNESIRFPFCTMDGLAEMCEGAGIVDAKVAAIEVETRFADFEAFWHPFTLGVGPAPGYCKSLSAEKWQALKQHLAGKLGTGGDIVLPARAWAASGSRPS